MKIHSTLEAEIRPGRAVGNATRQIDKAIQLLFDGHRVKVEDHFIQGVDKIINRRLLELILRRLETECNLQHMVEENEIKWDLAKNEIWLIKK